MTARDDVWLYVAGHSSIETADRLVNSLTTRFLLLAAHPYAGRQPGCAFYLVSCSRPAD
jgi:plasmid stabilization system protein ParE